MIRISDYHVNSRMFALLKSVSLTTYWCAYLCRAHIETPVEEQNEGTVTTRSGRVVKSTKDDNFLYY